ncbi:MAG: pseudouridine synthase [Acidobacteriota bacterium]|nr:pseudouridine synthase [Acidobacteriota bacterium]
MLVRLNKFLSMQGVASRREADRMIQEGRVQVNGRMVEDLGVKIEAEGDRVAVDGRLIRSGRSLIYLALNKPPGYLVTRDDPEGRPTVMALLPKLRKAVFPVGRLDFDSEGLLLLTNDGELAFRLTHPRFEIKKVYAVEVEGEISAEEAERLEKGVRIDGRRTAPARVRVLGRGPRGSLIQIEIHEGRKREVRRMMDLIGHRVRSLKRIEFAGLELLSLPLGQWRHLRHDEVQALRRRAGLE